MNDKHDNYKPGVCYRPDSIYAIQATKQDRRNKATARQAEIAIARAAKRAERTWRTL